MQLKVIKGLIETEEKITVSNYVKKENQSALLILLFESLMVPSFVKYLILGSSRIMMKLIVGQVFSRFVVKTKKSAYRISSR